MYTKQNVPKDRKTEWEFRAQQRALCSCRFCSFKINNHSFYKYSQPKTFTFYMQHKPKHTWWHRLRLCPQTPDWGTFAVRLFISTMGRCRNKQSLSGEGDPRNSLCHKMLWLLIHKVIKLRAAPEASHNGDNRSSPSSFHTMMKHRLY